MSEDLSVTQDTDVRIAPAGTEIAVIADYEVEVIQTFEQGPPGPQGPQGPLGPVGPAGPEGPHGNTIHYGARDPLPGDGLPGDSWINTATNTLFGPKSLTGVWPAGVSLIGPQGIQGNVGPQGIQGPQGPQGIQGIPGNTVLYGSVDPGAGTGVDGNFYINTTTHFMFGPKALGAWPAGTSLIGPQGPQGPQGIPGAVAEAPTDGQTYGRRGSDASWQLITISGTVRYDSVQALTVAQKTQARQNIAASPIDAMAYHGALINGAIEINIDPFNVGASTHGSSICDGWQLFKTDATAVILGRQFLSNPGVFPGFGGIIELECQVPHASLGVSDGVGVYQVIEGWRAVKLAFGTPQCLPMTLGFWSRHVRTGIYSGTLRCVHSAHSYAFEYTQVASAANQWNVINIPPCTTGGLPQAGTGEGLYLTFAMAAGSDLRLSAGVWSSGTTGAIASQNQINAIAANTDRFLIGGIVLLPGLEAPTADRAWLALRQHQDDLRLCQRYCQYFPEIRFNDTQSAMAGRNFQFSVSLPERMRIAPTLSFHNVTVNRCTSPGAGFSNPDAFGIVTTNVAAGSDDFSLTTSVRLLARLA
ncbi:hypothetical protein A1D31_22280 [Bradyrhizobium liaoningense]|nr:hypothetical protein A1D31_22280 [Bradyrhizobium liaoningense]